MTDLILYKVYDQEDIVDLDRNIYEAIEMYSTGLFTVRIEWTDDDDKPDRYVDPRDHSYG